MSHRVVHPAELERELSERAARLQEAAARSAPRVHGRRGRARVRFAGVLGVMALMLVAVSGVFAVHDANFQLEGNQDSNDKSTGLPAPNDQLGGSFAGPYDWFDSTPTGGGTDGIFKLSGVDAVNNTPLPTGFVAAGFAKDMRTKVTSKGTVFDTSDGTTFTVGSKDTLEVNQWSCVGANNVTDKGDIANAYATMEIVNGHRIIYFGLEKSAVQGDNNVGFWFLQNGASCPPDQTGNGTNFTGTHANGDVFVVSEFTNGGGISTIKAYVWSNGALGTTPVAVGADCLTGPAAGSGGDAICATTNRKEITPAWQHVSKTGGLVGAIPVAAFFEGGVDLDARNQSGDLVFGFTNQCFANFLANTRSSQSLTATLYDYALGTLPTCDANISIAASGTNKVGQPHTFTITANALNSIVPSSYAITASVSPSPDSFDTSDCASPTISNGGLTATCEVVITDAQPGVFTVNASVTVTYTGGATLTRDTDPATVTIGSGPGGSGPVTKTYVDARISIVESGTNKVGDAHTFTVTVEKNLGTGGGWVAASGVTVTGSKISGVGSITGGTCTTTVTDSSGQCTLIVDSASVGTGLFKASATVTVSGVNIDVATDGYGAFTVHNSKTWVDARITIATSGTNGITEAHTFTVTVEKNDGSGWVAAAGETVASSITGTGSITGGTCTTTVTDASGQCTVIVNSSTAGTGTVNASTTVTVGGIDIDVATDGYGAHDISNTKTWVDGSLTWLKHDNNGQLLGGATFQVCRTFDRFGNDIADVCVTVVDNSAPDTDPVAGQFKLEDLILGRYTITETVAPPTYTLDPFVETIELTLADPDKAATHIWVNTPGGEGCTPGYWKTHPSTWDQPTDPTVVAMPDGINAAGVSYTFTTSTNFNTYFGLTTQKGLSASATMLDATAANGGGKYKLARHGVSALLNVAALGSSYPLPPGITSFEDLYNALRNAFLTGNYEPLATMLADNNNLDHQNCPT